MNIQTIYAYQRIEKAQPNPGELHSLWMEIDQAQDIPAEEKPGLAGRIQRYLDDHVRSERALLGDDLDAIEPFDMVPATVVSG